MGRSVAQHAYERSVVSGGDDVEDIMTQVSEQIGDLARRLDIALTSPSARNNNISNDNGGGGGNDTFNRDLFEYICYRMDPALIETAHALHKCIPPAERDEVMWKNFNVVASLCNLGNRHSSKERQSKKYLQNLSRGLEAFPTMFKDPLGQIGLDARFNPRGVLAKNPAACASAMENKQRFVEDIRVVYGQLHCELMVHVCLAHVIVPDASSSTRHAIQIDPQIWTRFCRLVNDIFPVGLTERAQAGDQEASLELLALCKRREELMAIINDYDHRTGLLRVRSLDRLRAEHPWEGFGHTLRAFAQVFHVTCFGKPKLFERAPQSHALAVVVSPSRNGETRVAEEENTDSEDSRKESKGKAAKAKAKAEARNEALEAAVELRFTAADVFEAYKMHGGSYSWDIVRAGKFPRSDDDDDCYDNDELDARHRHRHRSKATTTKHFRVPRPALRGNDKDDDDDDEDEEDQEGGAVRDRDHRRGRGRGDRTNAKVMATKPPKIAPSLLERKSQALQRNVTQAGDPLVHALGGPHGVSKKDGDRSPKKRRRLNSPSPNAVRHVFDSALPSSDDDVNDQSDNHSTYNDATPVYKRKKKQKRKKVQRRLDYAVSAPEPPMRLSSLPQEAPPTPQPAARPALAAPASTVEKRIRRRVKFSEEEEEMLREGVRQMGVGHWASILSMFNFHPSRTGQSLKDKWRNIERQDKRGGGNE